MKYYESCSTLPIYNFYKILDGDMRYLAVGFNGMSNIDVELLGESNSVFDKIMEEYSELTSNNDILISIRLKMLIMSQEYEVGILHKSLDLFQETNEYDVLKLMLPFGFDIKYGDDLEVEIKKVIRRIKGLRNKVKINKSKYNDRFNKNKKEVKHNIEEEALLLEVNLKLGREINVHTTSVTKWISMINLSKARNIQAEKQKTN